MRRLSKIFALISALALVHMVPEAAEAQESGLLSGRTASVTIGPYFRGSLGSVEPNFGNGYWRPPGFGSDPEIRFDVDGDTLGMGTLALGYDWQGWRAEVAVSRFGSTNVSGSCSSASDGSSCAVHADIESASLATTAAMGNVYYAPFEARGSHSVFQPFLVAGLGIASNSMGEWTRTNPGATSPSRTFEGNRNRSLAWSVGIGASYQVTRPGRWPVLLEASWRFHDLGSAVGGALPLPGSGMSQPVQPLKFDVRHSVFEIGVRIPLERF